MSRGEAFVVGLFAGLMFALLFMPPNRAGWEQRDAARRDLQAARDSLRVAMEKREPMSATETLDALGVNYVIVLAPTAARLQGSAQDLVRRMCAVTA